MAEIHGRDGHATQGTYSATYGYRYGGRLYNFTSNFPGEAAAVTQTFLSVLPGTRDGRLHRRTVGTDIKVYRYDAGWNAINTEDNAGTLQAASVYEPGQSVGQRLAYSYGSLGTGTVVYAYHDQLGSTRRWRLNKSNWGANEYEPYGEAYAVSTLAPRDYALHEWDPAIAAYRAPYRNYSPAMARWMTRDPLGMVDGPNMYGYVGGEAINQLDPLGLHGDCGTLRRAMGSACAGAFLMLSAELLGMYMLGLTCAAICTGTLGLGCAACMTAFVSTLLALPLLSCPPLRMCANLVEEYLSECT